MVVADNRSKIPSVEFRNLSSGTVFEHGGAMFMVIGPVENSLGTIMCNAVTISHGLTRIFRPSDMVIPLNCRLIVENNGVVWENDCTEVK